MVTYYLYQIFKNNLQVLKIFDLMRDILLIIIIITSLALIISESYKKKKLNKFVFFELGLGLILTIFITTIIKTNYPLVRPISFFYPGEQFLDSFPSRHTAISFAISTIIFNNYPEWGMFLFLISILVSLFSWISLSHWPLDILVGGFLGFFISIIILEFAKILLRLYTKNIE